MPRQANVTSAAATAEFTPTKDSRTRATRLRLIALLLWLVAIGLEITAIVWLMRQRTPVGDQGLARNPDTGLLETQGAEYEFPQWAFIAVIVAFVLIGALAITGSLVWKKANKLNPARRSEPVRFFVQNQLGAIVAIVAFLPLIIVVLLNKDMSKSQKGVAAALGGVLAVAAVVFGIDFNPPSVEQYTAEQSTVIQVLGKDEVVWVDGGTVYHVCAGVPDVTSASTPRVTGTTTQAAAAGKIRLTLEFAAELEACGLPVPQNSAEITDAIRAIRDGAVDTVLPAPEYAEGVTPPFRPGG